MGSEQVQIERHGFTLLSGVRRSEETYAVLASPPDASRKRKGSLALLVEGAGDHPSLTDEVSRIALETIVAAFYEDNALSVTSSLLNAIELANSAVLEHCYAPQTGVAAGAEHTNVAVQSGGARSRGARVGLTAVLFRPDLTGIYLSQLAPTQAYLVHNGMVSALPEPKGWRSDRESEGGAPEPISLLPAQSLGSQPGLVTDLTFRRVEPGDRVVLVSTSLAKLIDRSTADGCFFWNDTHDISEELFRLASEHGLARASASVLTIGAAPATATASPPASDRAPAVATTGGSIFTAHRDWEAYRREPARPPQTQPSDEKPASAPAAPAEVEGMDQHVPPYLSTEAEEVIEGEPPLPTEILHPPAADESEQKHPTLTLIQRHIEPPPYLAAMHEEQSEMPGATDFDGWEDAPPALQKRDLPHLARITPIEEGAISAEEWRELYRRTGPAAPVEQEWQYRVLATPTTPPPQIFGDAADLWDDVGVYGDVAQEATVLAYTSAAPTRARLPRVGASQVSAKARRAMQWSKTALGNVLPDRRAGVEPAHSMTGSTAAAGTMRSVPHARRAARLPRPSISLPSLDSIPGLDRLRGMGIPPRAAIAAAVGALLLVLLLSMVLVGGGSQQDEARTINNHLQQAKEAELIANQPGNSEAARRESLKLARERAAQALVLDPDSAEAKRLLAKVDTDLDRLDGVTRLRDPKLLFDLDAAAGVEGGVQATGALTPTGSLSEIVVQSNDAYLLDKTSGQVYRCLISTQACSAVLKSGETVGDRQVGALVAMTQRVGEVVVVDDKFAAYSFTASDGTWNAQVLGDSSALGRPVDVATYDGHLYLLGAKTGQIIKYASGAYGSPPSDWISDPAAASQVVDPVALAIDGSVYVLLGDGRILSMQGGKVTATLAPNPISNAPATDLHTNTDANDIYILYAASGTITRLSKDGQTLAQLKVPEGRLQSMSGMTVVEGKSKIYILEGRKVYEAVLPGRPAQNATGLTDSVESGGDGDVAPAGPPVQAKPTAAP